VHDAILAACRRWPDKTAIVDSSSSPARRLTYAEYGETVERMARGLVSAGVRPGERVAIFLYNSWEFCAAYHAATLAGAVPTPMNPSYRDREVHYQLENSGAAVLISDGPLVGGVDRSGLALRRVYTVRSSAPGALPISELLATSPAKLPQPVASPAETLAALPYSSGTTGLPKGVELTHANLVTNVYQFMAPGEMATYTESDTALCVLPLYHIYGLNVVLNPILMMGATLLLMPRFDLPRLIGLLRDERPTFLPLVPPLMNALCQAAEQGAFPLDHSVRYVKSGAAPLPPEMAKRFTSLTGIKVRQGYGMTEAAPVTHIGRIEPEFYRPETIGAPVALTDCRIVREDGSDAGVGEAGELVMRGPQFMRGYWRAPQATAAALRDGWYWSGDVACVDGEGNYRIVDRRKEMIKVKGFPVSPVEVESVLMEHPAVRDCGIVGRPDDEAGELPCAFVVLREDGTGSDKTRAELRDHVGQRLARYKQPHQITFVASIPRTPSGKILRRELRKLL